MKRPTANMIALAIMFSFAIVLISNLDKIHYIFMAASIIFASALFIWLSSKEVNEGNCRSQRRFLLSAVFFFFILTLIILLIRFRTDDYSRSTLSIFLMAVAWIAIFYQIMSAHRSMHKTLILIEILTLGLFCIYSQSLLFPSIIGVDPWLHSSFIDSIIGGAHIPENQSYSGTPLYHLLTIATIYIMDISFKSALHLIIIPSFLLVTSFSLSAIANKAFGNQVALITFLLFYMNSYIIMFSLNIIPNTVGFSLIAVGVLVLFNIKPSILKNILIIVLFFTIILCHSICSLVFMMILAIIWLYDQFTNMAHSFAASKRGHMATSGLLVGVFCLVILALWWQNMTSFMSYLSFLININFSNESIIPAYSITHEYLSTIPSGELIFNEIARTLTISIAIIGILFIMRMSDDFKRVERLKLCLGGSTLLTIAFVTTILGMNIIQPRFWFMGIGLLIPIIAYAILEMSKRISKSHTRAIFLSGIIIGLIAISSLFNPASCIDNPVFSEKTKNPLCYTASELQCASFMGTHIENQTIITDAYYGSCVLKTGERISGKMISTFPDSFLSGQSIVDDNNIWAIRSNVAHGTFISERSPFQLSFNTDSLFMEGGMNIIYTSNGATIYA